MDHPSLPVIDLFQNLTNHYFSCSIYYPLIKCQPITALCRIGLYFPILGRKYGVGHPSTQLQNSLSQQWVCSALWPPLSCCRFNVYLLLLKMFSLLPGVSFICIYFLKLHCIECPVHTLTFSVSSEAKLWWPKERVKFGQMKLLSWQTSDYSKFGFAKKN